MKPEIIVLIAIAFFVFLFVIQGIGKLLRLRREFIVPQGYAGLLHHHGKFVELLAPGRHVRWGRNYTIDASDLRRASFAVASQEVMTADNIAVKFSLVVNYEIADAVKAAQATQNWQQDVYSAAQLALRKVVSGVAFEALLMERLDIAPQLLASVQPEALKIGVTVHAVEVKDVMLPGDLKRAFGDVLKARQEGHAALERARGESASLRNLANAARVLEGNPALLNLRVLQSLASAQNAGNTLVLGMPAGFVPLKNGRTPGRQDGASAPES